MGGYFARNGLEALRKAAARKVEKPRRDAAWRAYVRQAMLDIGPLWDALSPEEREMTLALHSADVVLKRFSSCHESLESSSGA